jgi:hypothetical protein
MTAIENHNKAAPVGTPPAFPGEGHAANGGVGTPGDNGVHTPPTTGDQTLSLADGSADTPWAGLNHPFAGLTPGNSVMVASAGSDAGLGQILPSVGFSADAPEIPAPVQQAISQGAPIRFSSGAENQAAGRQPDYFFTPEGQMVPNPKATPSADGSINIQVQSKDPPNNQSLRDAVQQETKNQQAAAKDMIRLFQKAHPGETVPSWMQDLASSQPNFPASDFIPFQPAPHQQATPPPENNFVPRGVSGGGGGGGSGGGGGGGDGGYGGFAGNGGFDNQGYFKGSGGAGDGAVPVGGKDSHGAPLGAGETVQAKQLYDYFTEHGFSAAQASGILGNIQTESSFKTNAYNSGEGAIGLCQWEGGRRTELEHFAKEEGKPVTDWHVQADFIMHELKGDDKGGGSEKGAYAAIMAAHTPEQAAVAFQSRYERSASLGDRAANAGNIYHQLNA